MTYKRKKYHKPKKNTQKKKHRRRSNASKGGSVQQILRSAGQGALPVAPQPNTEQLPIAPPPYAPTSPTSEIEYKRIEQIVKSAIEDAKSDGIPPTVVQNQDSKVKKKVGELVEYEEKKHKKGLIAFPKHSDVATMDFFKLINLQNPKDIAGELNKYEDGISLKYVSMRGKLLRELKKRVLNPDNYNKK